MTKRMNEDFFFIQCSINYREWQHGLTTAVPSDVNIPMEIASPDSRVEISTTKECTAMGYRATCLFPAVVVHVDNDLPVQAQKARDKCHIRQGETRSMGMGPSHILPITHSVPDIVVELWGRSIATVTSQHQINCLAGWRSEIPFSVVTMPE
jgi:hypothetical protein